jgi:hypothetical protein
MRVRKFDKETVYSKLISKLFYSSTKQQNIWELLIAYFHFITNCVSYTKMGQDFFVYNPSGCNVGIGIYELCLRMASCDTIHISVLMEIGIGVQAILRICLKYLKRCNVVIT